MASPQATWHRTWPPDGVTDLHVHEPLRLATGVSSILIWLHLSFIGDTYLTRAVATEVAPKLAQITVITSNFLKKIKKILNLLKE